MDRAIFGLEVLLISLLGFLSFSAHASPSDEEIVVTLTSQLLETAVRYQQASPVEKESLLPQLSETAARRKVLLLEEIKKDPAAFLRHALPEDVRLSLPPELQPLIESHASLEGELMVLIADDFEKGRSETFYDLAIPGPPSRTYRLHFASKPPALLSGSRIKVKGVVLESEAAL